MRVLLVDDEPLARDRLRSLLTELGGCEIVAEGGTGEQAIALVQAHQPDLLFLDIRMPGMDGIEAANHLSRLDSPPAVVFTTAYDEHALAAFDAHAVDYLLKPIDTDDLEETILKIKKFNTKHFTIERLESALQNFNSKSNQKRITLNTDGKLLFLENDEILYAESDGNYSTIFLSDGQKIVLTKKLKEVNALLPSDSFFRIHNSYIINLNKIKEFLKTDGYVVLKSNHKIPVSRQKKSDFLDLL